MSVTSRGGNLNFFGLSKKKLVVLRVWFRNLFFVMDSIYWLTLAIHAFTMNFLIVHSILERRRAGDTECGPEKSRKDSLTDLPAFLAFFMKKARDWRDLRFLWTNYHYFTGTNLLCGLFLVCYSRSIFLHYSFKKIVWRLKKLPFCRQTSVSILMELTLWFSRGLQLCWRYWWAWAWWCTSPDEVPLDRPIRAVPLFALVLLALAVVGVESSSSKMSETESVTAGLFMDSPNERRMSQPWLLAFMAPEL